MIFDILEITNLSNWIYDISTGSKKRRNEKLEFDEEEWGNGDQKQNKPKKALFSSRRRKKNKSKIHSNLSLRNYMGASGIKNDHRDPESSQLPIYQPSPKKLQIRVKGQQNHQLDPTSRQNLIAGGSGSLKEFITEAEARKLKIPTKELEELGYVRKIDYAATMKLNIINPAIREYLLCDAKNDKM